MCIRDSSMGGGSEAERISAFNTTIARWRVPGLSLVQPVDVLPDTTNRAMTGLSVHHVHYIASKMGAEGFKGRDKRTGEGHDIPIVVHESASTALGAESLAKWGRAVAKEPGFPPAEHINPESFFTSLGNGHFFQALNLFRVQHPSLLVGAPYKRYDPAGDQALQAALRQGVHSIVLRADTPRRERCFISEMLNGSFHYKWEVHPSTGAVRIVPGSERAGEGASAFEALSKSLDSFELGVLVEQHTRTLQERAKSKSKL
eukprot:TRINITY_DN7777_c0_g1_i2.p1 TRINITY_DN7777_c0_g1~~TRINITY_DN7777_c0_g1_i2.p1  ORF type:complete len:259 (-),score=76.62 TRINITY_DN7777_c0_g1_i2:325-1101(-)